MAVPDRRTTKLFLGSPHSLLVRIDHVRFEDALALYERADDKYWGLVDCASFVVMRDLGCREALTSDRHLE
jgi:predicted nucleic acid-binding protein